VVSGPPDSIPYSPTPLGSVQGGAGWTFTPTEDLLVTAIASTAPQVNFWLDSNQVLASFDYSISNYDYSFESITPLLLLAGQNHSVSTQYPDFTSSVIVNDGSLSGDGGPLVSISSYLSLYGYSLLTTSGQLTAYSSDAVLPGPNFQFHVVSEPTIVEILAFGFIFCVRKLKPLT
jgi:hypothetical protein